MVYLEYRDLNGNEVDYFLTMSDPYVLKDILNTHYEINNVYDVGGIVGFSDYTKNELGVEIFYKDIEVTEDEFKNKTKTLFVNNLEVSILEQMFNILMCINVGESELDAVTENVYKYIRTLINGINYLDEDTGNYITIAYGNSEEWIINELLHTCVSEYCLYIRSIIKTHKKRIINDTGCMDITQCVNNLETGLIVESMKPEEIPTTVILYEYNTIETIHSTDMSNMFEDAEDEIITFRISYKLYAPKDYYVVVKDFDGFRFKERL